MLILGIDCATKTLGLSIIRYTPEALMCVSQHASASQADLMSQVESAMLVNIRAAISKYLQFVYFDVVDLVPGKQLKETDRRLRAARLKALLNCIDERYGPFDHVLIEYQMGPNDKSREISEAVAYHYAYQSADYASHNLPKRKADSTCSALEPTLEPTLEGSSEAKHTLTHVVGPSLKQKIAATKDLAFTKFVQKYASLYTANKAHAKANFIAIIQTLGSAEANKMLKAIPKKDVGNAADATLMIMAWYMHCSDSA